MATLDCPCGGQETDCQTCSGSGFFEVFQCPGKIADSEALEVVAFAEMAAEGNFAAGGCLFDQTAWFTEAASIVLDQRDAWKKANGDSDG